MRTTFFDTVVVMACACAGVATGSCGSARPADSSAASGSAGGSGTRASGNAGNGAKSGGTGTIVGASGRGGANGGVAARGAAGMGAGAVTSGDPTFTAVYAIMMAHCSGPTCHVGAFLPGGGLSLADKMTAYTNLVGGTSRKCTGQPRVTPGNPNASVLIQALERTGGCAPAMPQGAAALSATDINTIVAWIMAGAMNN